MEKVLKGEIFGDSTQALISKKGVPYLKTTVVEKDEDGTITKFWNCCLFPAQEDLQRMRGYLCKGRVVEITGNASERDYEGRDGQMRTAYDMLGHNVRFGGIVEYGGEQKNTDFSFIKDSDQKAADAQMAKSAKKPAKKQQTTAFVEPDEDEGEDDLFAAYDKAKAGAKAKAAKPKSKKAEEDDFDINDLDL